MSLLKEELLRLLFPEGLLDYFEIKGLRQLPEGGCEVFLEETSGVPKEYINEGYYIGHGFFDTQIINDFPLRGKKFNLKIHRRRWINKTTKKVVSRNWNLIAKGSSLSQEFADFLKELH